jgi:hypothetical protein
MALQSLRPVVQSAVLATALAMLGPGSARAAEDAIFAVASVQVDATADTAAAAREVALADGQRRALDILLQRITLREDRDRVPRPVDSQVAELVEALEIANERTSPVRYLADLTVRFKPEAVRTLLQLAGVSFAETVHKPLLVLPVYSATATAMPSLWDEPNPWRDVWVARPAAGGLVPLILPIGDLADIADLSAEDALRGNAARLDAIARRYQADGVIVVVARSGFDEVSGQMALTVTAQPHGGAVLGTIPVGHRIAGADTGMPVQALLEQAVQVVVDELEEAWKRDNLLRFDLQGTIEVTVPIGGLAEWVEVRRRLRQVAAVRHVRLRSLTRLRARLVLRHVGEVRQLALALSQRDLELGQDLADWVLRPSRPLVEPAARLPVTTLPPPPGGAAQDVVVGGAPGAADSRGGNTTAVPGPLPNRPLFQKSQ